MYVEVFVQCLVFENVFLVSAKKIRAILGLFPHLESAITPKRFENQGNRNNVLFKKCKTFSVLIYSYINTSGNWKNEKLFGNTTPAGRSVFIQFRVFPVFTSVDITVYQYG